MGISYKIKVFVIILTAFFPVGCIPGKMLSFETLTPAEYSFPSDAHKAIIFNSSYIPSADTSSFNILRKMEDPEEQYIVDTLIINNIFNGFFFITDQSPIPALQNAEYVELRSKDTTAFLSPLSNESIEYLLSEFAADLVISLEYYGMNFYSHGWYNDFSEYKAYLSIDRALLWRIYDLNGLQNEKMMRDTLSWVEFRETADEAKYALPRLVDAIRESFWYAGEEFARELSPSWKNIERSYFQLFDNGIDRSLDPVYLLEIIEDNRGLKIYKAYFNLAIYYEKEGNPAMALKYMNEALKLRPGAILPKIYQKQMETSVKEFEKLEEQLK